ncbi:MAG: hypothetical protein AB3N24_07330 [Leisingera sp.]
MEEHLQTLLAGALSCPVKWGFFKDGEQMPRVTLFRMSGGRMHTLRSKGLMRASVQIDSWGVEFADATTTSRAVRGVLEGYQGGPILSARLTAIRDGSDDGGDAAHRASLTFAITYRE